MDNKIFSPENLRIKNPRIINGDSSLRWVCSQKDDRVFARTRRNVEVTSDFPSVDGGRVYAAKKEIDRNGKVNWNANKKKKKKWHEAWANKTIEQHAMSFPRSVCALSFCAIPLVFGKKTREERKRRGEWGWIARQYHVRYCARSTILDVNEISRSRIKWNVQTVVRKYNNKY